MATLNSKFMNAVEVPTAVERKTRQYQIQSKSSGSVLGIVEWYGSWRQYCFEPSPNCVFSAGCLHDIEAFLAALMAERKGGL